ncbi:MAG: response regulator [Sphingomonas bacterium]|uniref:response regulator n=1 Tax=Sphingomonas bacterium TaxID=1895847 RepID=UPI002614A594|nr:response regulator [Sphingomonas bacterium]MDB5706371.1 response regulator [Sphingomonas bacterium]
MSKTALIVEDEIFVALDLERILTDAGYRVKAIAADRSTAIEAADDCHFALVDVNLRDGPTGPALATTLARDYGVKVIFVTANPAQIGAAEGAIGYIRKPFSEAAILAAAAMASAGTPHGGAANDDLILLDRGVSDG